ncbi:MAG TPA: hypothetical protein VK020_03880 [Microlunatus sp.]|nr:hypothetical protein [Microlunatus sp.]
MSTADPSRTRDHEPRGFPRSVLDRWPSAAGLVVALVTTFTLDAVTDAAPVVTASAFIYLGAAALGLPKSAWPLFGLSFVLITIGIFVPAFDPSWPMVAVAVVLLGYGLIRGRGKPAFGLPLQSAAMLVLATLALAVIRFDATVAGVLIAVALLVHAGWDVHHHRRNRVVHRSMSEFCMVLDTALALLVLWVTFR